MRGTRQATAGLFRFAYWFDAQSGSVHHTILLAIKADSLGPGKYTDPRLVTVLIERDFKQYFTWQHAAKPFVITISRHNNGSVSGTFEGKLYVVYAGNSQPADSIAITGKLNEVYLQYK